MAEGWDIVAAQEVPDGAHLSEPEPHGNLGMPNLPRGVDVSLSQTLLLGLIAGGTICFGAPPDPDFSP